MANNTIVVWKGRVTQVTVDVGVDISADTLTSEIRTQPSHEAALIATWTVTKPSSTTLLLTLNDTGRSISATKGYMDICRVSGGSKIPLFDEPLEVEFRGTVTT